MPGDKKPGDDGYTTVGCKSAVLPALLMTLFYGLPRLALDSIRSRRASR